MTQLDAAEYGKALVQLVGVEYGGVLADVTQPFQALHALVGRRGGQVDLGCQFLVGKAGVVLKGP
jgi:hypothetical protein